MMKKLIAILLALTLAFSSVALFASADEPDTAEGVKTGKAGKGKKRRKIRDLLFVG